MTVSRRQCHSGVTQSQWLLPPRERDSQKFFFAQNRANFDDLRPLKAKTGTFEHLWGSKTRFAHPIFRGFCRRQFFSLKSQSEVFFGFFGPFYDLPRPISGGEKKIFFFLVKNRRPFANHHAIMPRFWAFFIFFSHHATIMPRGVVGQGFRYPSPGDFPPDGMMA